MEKTLKADGMCGIQNLSNQVPLWALARDECLPLLKKPFFMILPSMWSDFPRGRHILKQLHFQSVGNNGLESNSYVTSGGLDPSIFYSREMTLLPLYYTFKILKWRYHFRVLHLSHVVNYPMQSQEKDSCMQYCFCLQDKIGGIVYPAYCRRSNQLLDSPLWKLTWLW